jgi:GAF domain-containing protein
LLILPLIYNERLSGVIALATLNEFTLEQQVFLEDIAESIAMDLLARRSQSSQA